MYFISMQINVSKNRLATIFLFIVSEERFQGGCDRVIKAQWEKKPSLNFYRIIGKTHYNDTKTVNEEGKRRTHTCNNVVFSSLKGSQTSASSLK